MTEFFEKLDNIGNTEAGIIGIIIGLSILACVLVLIFIREHLNRHK